MARTNTRFINAFNTMLTRCEGLSVGDHLPSETVLSHELGVSRTVVRSILANMETAKILSWKGRTKTLLRHPVANDHLEEKSELLTIDALEDTFLDWVLRMDVPPGTVLNVTQLSKDFSVATHTLQEFLTALSRYGIVERRARGGWVLLGFTIDFAIELSDFRMLLEFDAIEKFIARPNDDPVWHELQNLKTEHLTLLDQIDHRFHDFSRLDERFHNLINGVVANRFVKESQKVISLIFHYHYQWNKSDERQRNADAIQEHLAYIDALQSRDLTRVRVAATTHLSSSKQTLLNSLRSHNHRS